MNSNPIYLDSYTVQSDARIRLPKSALENLSVAPGKTRFKIYLDTEKQELIFKIDNESMEAK